MKPLLYHDLVEMARAFIAASERDGKEGMLPCKPLIFLKFLNGQLLALAPHGHFFLENLKRFLKFFFTLMKKNGVVAAVYYFRIGLSGFKRLTRKSIVSTEIVED